MKWGRFALQRFLSSLPVFFFLPFFTLALMHLVPGNYFDSLRLNPQISPEMIRLYEEMFHLDKPFFWQYFFWLKNLFQGNLGYSFVYYQPVTVLLLSRLGNTLLLTIPALLISWLAGIALGLHAGWNAGKKSDRFLSFLSYLGLSLPSFFLCLLLTYAAFRWGAGIPLGGMRSILHEEMTWPQRILDIARHMIIPVAVLSLGNTFFIFRLMRAQVMEVKNAEFIFFLRACNIPERVIKWKHVFRNALNPLLSLLGMELPALFSGAALVEIFTGWPGLGQLMLQAVRSQDIFLVLGNITVLSFLLIAGNLLSDFLLAFNDPRVRLES